MAISYVASHVVSGNNLTSGSFTLPTSGPQAGDLALCIYYCRVTSSTKSFSPPTLTGTLTGSDGSAGYLWVGYKFLSESDISNGYVGAWTAGTSTNATNGELVSVFRGVDTTTPLDGVADVPASYYCSSNLYTFNGDGITPNTNGAAIVGIVAGIDDMSGVTTSSNYTADWASFADNTDGNIGGWSNTGGADAACWIEWRLDRTGGVNERPTDPGTCQSASAQAISDLFVLKPASSGSTKQGTATPVACAVSASTGSRTRARNADTVSAADATASGLKITTKNGTADVVCAVASTGTGSAVQGQTKQGTASVAAVASTGGVTSDSLTVWSGTGDGRVRGFSDTYATARSTGGDVLATGDLYIGQWYPGDTYWRCYESFLGFDTSSIEEDSTITTATLSLYGAVDGTTTDFTLQARIYDWSADGLTASDFRSGNPSDANSIDEYTLVASYDTSGGWPTNAYTNLTSESAFLTNVSTTGSTYIVCNSTRHLNGDVATGAEYAQAYSANDNTGGGGTDRDPKLYVEWSVGGGGPTGSRIRQRTATGVVAAEATATGSKVRQGTASVTAIASTGGVTSDSLTVWSTTADGHVYGFSGTYSTAASTAFGSADAGTSVWVAQRKVSTNFYCYESFFGFDTSSVGSGSTVTTATLSLYRATEATTVEYTVEARIRDWGGTLTTADWVAGASLGDYTLVASRSTDPTWSGSAYSALTSDSAFLSNIAQTGMTYVMCNSSLHRTQTEWTDYQEVSVYSANDETGGGGTDRDPKLYVEWTAGTGTQGQRIRQRTADASCAVAATATGSKVRQGTASVTAIASTGGVTSDSLTVWSSTADGYIAGQNATYATARSTAYAAYPTSLNGWIGQLWDETDYYTYELFLDFNTSSVGSGSTVTTATLSLYGKAYQADPDFTVEARIRDWGGTLTTADWVAGASLGDYTLVASKATSGGWPTNAYTALTSESAFLTNVAQSGTTYVMCSSDRLRGGNTPTSMERVNNYSAEDATGDGGTDRDPKLYVEWTAGSGTQGQRIRHRDASVTAAVETLATGEKTGGTTKQGTADVVAVAVTDSLAGALRPRTGTADAPAVATAAGGALRPRTGASDAVADATAAGKRIRLASADVVACADATAQAGEVEVTTASVVAAADATASGTRTRRRTADVASVAVGTATAVRTRARTAEIVAVAVATGSAGEIEVTSADVAAVAVATATGTRTRRATAAPVACAVATAAGGAVQAATAETVACAVSTATGNRIRSRTASVVACADATGSAGEIEVVTADVSAVAVSTASGGALRPRTADVSAVVAATAVSGGQKAGSAEVAAAAVASASGARVRQRSAEVAAPADAAAAAGALRTRSSEAVTVAVATATGQRVSRRTSSVFAVAVGTAAAGALRLGTASTVAAVDATGAGGGGTNASANVTAAVEATATGFAIRSATADVTCVAATSSSAKNICAVTFTEPHDNDRYERTVAGTIAWTCTPVENVTFHLYAVARGSAVEYYLKDVASDGTGSYSTSDGFEIPPGQFRMKAVVD